MADRLSTDARSRIMSAIRSKNTKPELIVRKSLFASGYRYRLHPKELPGKPDLVFSGRKKAIFIHGCFWHQHSDSRCPIRVSPTSNEQYWIPKLSRNISRDAQNESALVGRGWRILIVWECELRANEEAACKQIKSFLGPPRM
jgi:DNA mismatch endonuclease (patch repair protein)